MCALTNQQQSSPDETEDQNDVHFRHITEITILTVQLIVEFAKGLPAFTKIPQEDQITLLKVRINPKLSNIIFSPVSLLNFFSN